MILVQAALAALAIVCCGRMVLPAMNRLRHPALVLDVWLPVALVLPLMFLAVGVEGSVRGVGWFPIASPVVIGLAAFGGAMLLGGSAAKGDVLPAVRLTVAMVLAGVILLLLGAAHVMTIWVGQFAFAIGAVLLWINTPDEDAGMRQVPPSEIQMRAGWGMLIMLGCAIGQGVTALVIWQNHATWSGGIMLLTAIVILARSTRTIGTDGTMRIGLWASALGVFFGLGMLSLIDLPRRMLLAAVGELEPKQGAIAFGFGVYAFEATVLLVLAGLAWLVPGSNPLLRRVLGVLAMLALAIFLVIRLGATR